MPNDGSVVLAWDNDDSLVVLVVTPRSQTVQSARIVNQHITQF